MHRMCLGFNGDMGLNFRFRDDRLVYEVVISLNSLSTFD